MNMEIFGNYFSGRSTKVKWRHRHLNSRDSAFQNGDRFQVLTDFNGREDTINFLVNLIVQAGAIKFLIAYCYVYIINMFTFPLMFKINMFHIA
jgi:hypothetical protein